MNRQFVSLVGLLTTLSACAQGTFSASNDFTPSWVPPGWVPKTAHIYSYPWQILPQATGRVEFIRPEGVTISPGGNLGVPLIADGLFSIDLIVVPDVPPGGTVNLIVRAWDSATGLTFNSATVFGAQAVTIVGLGGGSLPPATLEANSNFQGFILVVPEPSSVALGLVGIAALLFAARRAT